MTHPVGTKSMQLFSPAKGAVSLRGDNTVWLDQDGKSAQLGLASDTGERGVGALGELADAWEAAARFRCGIPDCHGNKALASCAEQLRAALRAQPAGGEVKLERCPDGCYRPKATSADDCAAGCCAKWYAVRDGDAAAECAKLAAFWSPLTQPQPAEGGKCGCLDFCEDHGREFIEVTPDGEEYCHECSSDDGSGELCTPMAGSCDMLSQRSNEFQRSFMCPAHAVENVKFCDESYAERATQPESGGQGECQRCRDWTTMMGVGDGSGQLFVHGTHEAIKACQSRLLNPMVGHRGPVA